MSMDILKTLKEVETRQFYLDIENNGHLTDNLSAILDSSNEQYVYYIGINDFVLDFYKKNPKTNWKIKAVFQLGNPFLFFANKNTNNWKGVLTHLLLKDKQWSLFIFTKTDFESVMIGFDDLHRYAFDGEFKYDDEKSYYEYGKEEYLGRPVLDKNYTPTRYFELINFAIENDTVPDLTEEEYNHHLIAFNSVPSQNFFLKYLNYLSRYKKSVVDDFGLPTAKEKILPLKNIVQFVHQFTGKDDTVSINKNDIVTNGLFLDYDTNSVSKHIEIVNGKEINKYNFVFRSFSLSPYYIWALLNSEFLQDYCLAHFEWYDGVFEPVEMDELPCIIPEQINEAYFKKKYEIIKQAKLSVQEKLENKEDDSFFDKNAKQIILKDLAELRLCFKSKAYKAAIIMAGSILEAFLIDWLSEIDGVNYFTQKTENDRLLDYINRIQDLKKSSWDDAAKKATEIRKKRNLVHAKLYINDNDISKETCTEVINYLEYVVKTRWK